MADALVCPQVVAAVVTMTSVVVVVASPKDRDRARTDSGRKNKIKRNV